MSIKLIKLNKKNIDIYNTLNVRNIYVEVLKDNIRSVNAFFKLGFRIVEENIKNIDNENKNVFVLSRKV